MVRLLSVLFFYAGCFWRRDGLLSSVSMGIVGGLVKLALLFLAVFLFFFIFFHCSCDCFRFIGSGRMYGVWALHISVRVMILYAWYLQFLCCYAQHCPDCQCMMEYVCTMQLRCWATSVDKNPSPTGYSYSLLCYLETMHLLELS
jgi:hypothetical protein